jgi:hypothetical protein
MGRDVTWQAFISNEGSITAEHAARQRPEAIRWIKRQLRRRHARRTAYRRSLDGASWTR